MPTTISRHDLARCIAEGSVLVIEALSAGFYSDAHLPGAINIPLSALDSKLWKPDVSSELPIVVYGSRTGGEATEVATWIESLGHRDVRVYEGGKEEWVEAGLAVERTIGLPEAD